MQKGDGYASAGPEFVLGEPSSVDVDSLKWGELATVLGCMSGYIMVLPLGVDSTGSARSAIRASLLRAADGHRKLCAHVAGELTGEYFLCAGLEAVEDLADNVGGC